MILYKKNNLIFFFVIFLLLGHSNTHPHINKFDELRKEEPDKNRKKITIILKITKRKKVV